MISTIEHIDRTKFPPTISGAFGAAWEVDVAALAKAIGKAEKADGTVCAWVVCAPWAHPLWAYYLTACVHLRPLPALGGATHEIFVAAMDPRQVPTLDRASKQVLLPLNFAGQWVVTERPNPVDLDRAAASKVRGCVEDILAATLNPDTDFRWQWVQRFSDSNLK